MIRAADGAQIARLDSRKRRVKRQARCGINLRQRQASAFCCVQQGVIAACWFWRVCEKTSRQHQPAPPALPTLPAP